MAFNLQNILTETLKFYWDKKELFLPYFGTFILVVIFIFLKALLTKKSKLNWMLSKKHIREVQNLTPTEFENYIAELFRSHGFKTNTVGGVGDGGIDVVAEKNGLVHYIQCKKFITRKVPVGAVRDFYGAIADKVDGGKGYFITTNVFTLEAEKFAEDKPIELVDRFKLVEYMKNAKVEVKTQTKELCPKCGGNLIERKGKFGSFLGCNKYPKCDFTKKSVI